MYLLGEYVGPAAVAAFITAKGIAAAINNNLDTSGWPAPLRVGLDWLASANKKAKHTTDLRVNNMVDIEQKVGEAKAGSIGKLLKMLS